MSDRVNEPKPYAFPVIDSNGCVFHFGMDLRDYFAAQIAAALIGSENGNIRADAAATAAYKFADAMMVARRQGT